MVIFHSYVSLPEGTIIDHLYRIHISGLPKPAGWGPQSIAFNCLKKVAEFYGLW